MALAGHESRRSTALWVSLFSHRFPSPCGGQPSGALVQAVAGQGRQHGSRHVPGNGRVWLPALRCLALHELTAASVLLSS